MKKKQLAVLASTFTLGSVMAACSGGENADSENSNGSENGEANGEQVVDLSIDSDIPTMDPSLATDVFGIQWAGETYEGLYRLGENGAYEEGIAAGEPKQSEDGLTWTFDLRDDAEWSNGDPVTAEDFVYSWHRALDPETASEYGPYLMNGVIKNAEAVSSGEMEVEDLGVTALDEHTLEVELASETPYFQSLTTFPTFAPLNEEYVEEQGEDFAVEADTMMSNGPFKVEAWDHGENIKLVKNEDYWDADAVQLEEINVQVIKEVSTGVNLFDTGELDRTSLSAEFVDEYSTDQNYKAVESVDSYFIKFNQENELLANENIRKAIQKSIDKEGLTETILNDGSIPSTGLMPSEFVFSPEGEKDFREANGDLAVTDKEEAQKLWEQGMKELGMEEAELGFLGEDTEVASNVNAYIKEQLEENLKGLTVNVEQVPFQIRLDRDTNMEYDMQYSKWLPDYVDPNTYMNLFETDGQNNRMAFSNEEYDALLEEANTDLADQPQERWDNYLQMEEILVEEEAGLAPLYQSSDALLETPALQGTIRNAAGLSYEYKWAYMNEAAVE